MVERLKACKARRSRWSCSAYWRARHDDDPGGKRAIMPCGHAIGPKSLTAYCRSLLTAGKSQFFCIYVDNNNGPRCNQEWSYIEVHCYGVLLKEEQKEFETKILENYLQKAMGIQECPGCGSLCERLKKKDKCLIKFVESVLKIKGGAMSSTGTTFMSGSLLALKSLERTSAVVKTRLAYESSEKLQWKLFLVSRHPLPALVPHVACWLSTLQIASTWSVHVACSFASFAWKKVRWGQVTLQYIQHKMWACWLTNNHPGPVRGCWRTFLLLLKITLRLYF